MAASKSKEHKLPQSTYERLMQNADFGESFEIEYREFTLSEIVLQLMKEKRFSVRELARVAGVSPAVIQDIRSGHRRNITLNNLSKILKALDSCAAIQVGGHYMPLEG
ncbi:MAG: helix-turn-helix transcriptional regulator [Candidatus Omnitrophota bacterium]